MDNLLSVLITNAAMSDKIVVETLQKVEDQLTCAVCLNCYTDPRVLPCLHVFCQECLKLIVKTDNESNYVSCPSCRRVARLTGAGTADLVPAFHIHHLFDIQDALKKAGTIEKSQCEKCQQHLATAFCRNCGQYVCDQCVKTHKLWSELTSHEVVSIHRVQDDAAKLVPVKKKALLCSRHANKDLELYCETCAELICHNCTVQQHKEHSYDLVTDVFSTHKEAIEAKLAPLKDMLDKVNRALLTFDVTMESIVTQQKAIGTDIEETIRHLHEELEQRKVEFLDQLHETAGEKMKSLTAQRDQVELMQTQLGSAVDFTEERLRTGSEGEILAVKKYVVTKSQELIREFDRDLLVPRQRANVIFKPQRLKEISKPYRAVGLAGVAPQKCVIIGGSHVAMANEPFTLLVQIKDENDQDYLEPVENITAELVSPTTTLICEVEMEDEPAKYSIRCTPTLCKEHELHVLIGEEHIQGSPFQVLVKRSITDITRSPKMVAKLKKPCGVVCNNRAELIVVESGLHKVSIFTSRGLKLVKRFGSRGTSSGQFVDPNGVTVDGSDNILVVDSGNHRIQKFTAEGEFITTVGTKGDGPLQFNLPTNIRIHPQSGNMYVCDQYNHRIQILKEDFSFVSSFGREGSEDGNLYGPTDVAFDAAGNVYVCDSWNNRIQVFDSDGKYVRKFGDKKSEVDSGQSPLLPSVAVSKSDGGEMVMATVPFIESASCINMPSGLYIDCDGHVFVTEAANCVTIFKSDGTFFASFGTEGSGLVEFNNPHGIARNSEGVVCVSDYGNGRIQLF